MPSVPPSLVSRFPLQYYTIVHYDYIPNERGLISVEIKQLSHCICTLYNVIYLICNIFTGAYIIFFRRRVFQ